MKQRTKKTDRRATILLVVLTVLTVLIGGMRLGEYLDRQRLVGKLPPARNTWRITQYAGQSGNQSMCYSIVDSENRLILIDGGWDTDADVQQVLEIIRAHENHVTAWFITHAHPDHVGVFNAIVSHPEYAVTIDHVYTPKVNRERYIETAQDYDGIESFYQFQELTASMEQVTELEANDELELLGLDIRVLHAWDAHVDEMPDHLMNLGSLMFVVSGRTEQMLFCSDVQSEMEAYIEETHGDELEHKYVQCGHHGNWGLSTGFYDRVHPEYAFIDAPEYIRSDESGTFDCPALIQYFKDRETTILTWDVPWNSIILH